MLVHSENGNSSESGHPSIHTLPSPKTPLATILVVSTQYLSMLEFPVTISIILVSRRCWLIEWI
jgi:hypothetical protein